MCLANDFATLSAPHLIKPLFHLTFFFFKFYFISQSFSSSLWLPGCLKTLCSFFLNFVICRYELPNSFFFCLSCLSCFSTLRFLQCLHGRCLSGICASLAALSLVVRHWAGIPSRVHWQCSSGSLLTAPLITQGHNHRPLWSNSQFAMSPPFNRTASTQAGAASWPWKM